MSGLGDIVGFPGNKTSSSSSSGSSGTNIFGFPTNKAAASSRRVRIGDVKYQEHVRNARFGGGLTTWNKKSNIAKNQLVGNKKTWRLKNNQGEIATREVWEEVGKLIKKNPGRLSGRKIKHELKKMGLKWDDAQRIAGAVVYDYIDPGKGGLTDKQKAYNIRYQRFQRMEEEESGMAKKLSQGREKGDIKKRMEGSTSKRIGAVGRKYGISVNTKELDTDAVRNEESSATINTAAASGENAQASGMDVSNAEEMTAAIGAKQQEKKSDSGSGAVTSGADTGHISFNNSALGSVRVGSSLDENTPLKRDPRGKLNVFDLSEYRKTHPLMQDDDQGAPIAGNQDPSHAREVDTKLHQASPNLSDNLSMFSDSAARDYDQGIKKAA